MLLVRPGRPLGRKRARLTQRSKVAISTVQDPELTRTYSPFYPPGQTATARSAQSPHPFDHGYGLYVSTRAESPLRGAGGIAILPSIEGG